MKKLLLTLFVASFSMAAMAQPPKGKAKQGDFYGEKPSAAAIKNAMDADDLAKNMATQDSMSVAIEGKVLEVCDKKGCWIRLKGEGNEEIFVKMKNYEFFVPTALKGKNVVLDGYAKKKLVSVDEQRHYAEDAKKSQAEIEAITEPKTEIRYMASGIVVVD